MFLDGKSCFNKARFIRVILFVEILFDNLVLLINLLILFCDIFFIIFIMYYIFFLILYF